MLALAAAQLPQMTEQRILFANQLLHQLIR